MSEHRIKKSHRAQGSTADRLFTRDNPRHDFVRTPAWMVEEMADMADVSEGCSVLDPCIGDGPILKILHQRTGRAVGIEQHPDLFELSLDHPGWRVVLGDFLKLTPEEIGYKRFHAVVMNPPFSKLGAWRFIKHAVENWIVPHGRCVSVVPQYILDNAEGRKPWLDQHIWNVRVLPKHAFAPAAPTLHACAVEFRPQPKPKTSSFGFMLQRSAGAA